MRCAAPLEECRTTNMSACIAERLSTVSSSVSPLVEDDAAMFRLMTSAESRFAAISYVVRVRVEGSKKRLKTDLPSRSGSFASPLSCGFRIGEPQGEFALRVARQAQELAVRHGERRAGVLRGDR